MRIKVKREYVERMISTCERILRRGSDPFVVEVEKYVSHLKSFLTSSKSTEDLILDLEALEALSRIVEFQGRWIRDKSTKLYFDPLLVELKIKSLDLDDLAHILCSAFFPISSLRLISRRGFEEAADYWVKLPPLRGRWGKLPQPIFGVESASFEDLIRSRLALKGSFTEMLEEFWVRVKVESESRKLYYWDFVRSEDFEESLLKAYMLSFLATYGYIGFDFDPKVNDYIIIPYDEKIEVSGSRSIAIPFSYKDWLRRFGHG